MYIANKFTCLCFSLQRTSYLLGHHSFYNRALSSRSTYSDSSSDYVYDSLHPYRTLDDDYVRASVILGREASQRLRNSKISKNSRDSIRRYLSADDISYVPNDEFIECPAQDISTLQQQLALHYVPEIPQDDIL